MPRTLQSMVADLHALLHKADVPRPYLLVAHSYGGLIVRYYAQNYPREAAGMVLVDAFGTNIKRLFGRLWPRYEHLLNFPGTPLENQSGWETVDTDGAIRAINNAKLPRMPLAVISKTEPFATAPGTPKDLTRRLEQVWPKVQSALVSLEPLTPHIFATGSDHYVEINDPDLTISSHPVDPRSRPPRPRGLTGPRAARSRRAVAPGAANSDTSRAFVDAYARGLRVCVGSSARGRSA